MKKLNYFFLFILIIALFFSCTDSYYISGCVTVHIANENGELLKKEEAGRFEVHSICDFAIGSIVEAENCEFLTYETFFIGNGNMMDTTRIEDEEKEFNKVLNNAIKGNGIQIIDKKGEYKTKIYTTENAKYKKNSKHYYEFEYTVLLEKN